MGAVLTIHLMNTASDDVHIGCEHEGSYFTWYVSSDKDWLIVKRFEGGTPRTQVPMVNIRALSVALCPQDQQAQVGQVDKPTPPAKGPLRGNGNCACRLVNLDADEDEWADPVGRVHRRNGPDEVYCDGQTW